MHPDLELALELADTAVEIALPRFEDRDFTVTIKPDGSPVTSVDYAVERALRDQIAQQRPEHAILGEEYGRSGDSEWRWYLDPIDGTSRFVNGDPNWMTFVALGRGADITVAVISVPARSERWWAYRMAREWPRFATASRSRCRGRRAWRMRSSTTTGSRARRLSGLLDGGDAARRQRAVLAGTRVSSVAAGVADVATLRAASGHAWDYAAAKVIVEECSWPVQRPARPREDRLRATRSSPTGSCSGRCSICWPNRQRQQGPGGLGGQRGDDLGGEAAPLAGRVPCPASTS